MWKETIIALVRLTSHTKWGLYAKSGPTYCTTRPLQGNLLRPLVSVALFQIYSGATNGNFVIKYLFWIVCYSLRAKLYLVHTRHNKQV